MRPWWVTAVPAGLIRAFLAVSLTMALHGQASANGLSGPADAVLAEARAKAAEALATYPLHAPDHRLWAAALAKGREAADLAAHHPEPRRFLAETYQTVGWYSRAWESWLSYLELGGDLDAPATERLLAVAAWMGTTLFEDGRRDAAVPYLEMVLQLDPTDLGANARLARFHLDRVDLLAALPFLEAVVDRRPELEPHLAHARLAARFGRTAAAAYHTGWAAESTGAQREALEHYLEAVRLRDDFVAAWERIGHVAALLESWSLAELAFAEVTARSPDDAEAFVWLARLALTRGDVESAGVHLQHALELDPDTPAVSALVDEMNVLGSRPLSPAANRDHSAAAETPQLTVGATTEQEVGIGPEDAATDATIVSIDEPARSQRTELEGGVTVSDAAITTIPLFNIRVEHRMTHSPASGGVAFIQTPWLARDLTEELGEVLVLDIDVLDKPTAEPVLVQVCLVPPDVRVGPACSDPNLLRVTAPGTVRAEQPLGTLEGGRNVDWRHGIKSVMLVLRHPDGRPLGSAGSEQDMLDHLPMTSRLEASWIVTRDVDGHHP